MRKLKNIGLVVVLLSSFISCKKSEVITEEQKQDYLKKGGEIVQSSFQALSGKLTEQMQLGGPKQAIPFCNVEALPLTDSLSRKFNVSIKRTSDRIRNLKNIATKRELEIIDEYERLKSYGVVMQPILEKSIDNKIHFYAPIVINTKCIACHGKINETLNAKTDSIVKSLYPNDLATGYNDGDLRGIWSITFN